LDEALPDCDMSFSPGEQNISPPVGDPEP